MLLHDKAFWFIAFFLIGVLAASFVVGWGDRLLFAALAAIFAASIIAIFAASSEDEASLVRKRGRYEFALISLAIFLGAGYYFFYDARAGEILIPFGEKTKIIGFVEKSSRGLEKQDIVMNLKDPYKGKIKITTNRYPSWEYGDRVEAEGTVKNPSDRSRDRLAKDGIYGTMGFPKITLLERGTGSPIKSSLFKIKAFAEGAIHKALPPQKAAFMTGLLLGETAEFSKEFREKMSVTGTSHLVALSGYNISIVAQGVMGILGYWFSRRKTFWLSILAIIGFVVMTGAEASVVRAAIMGFIVLLAGHVERVHSFRNSLAVAAFFMVLANPRVLLWDIGFQLSFAAVMGLAYLKPAIERIFKVSPKPGFLNWKENFFTTFSAQLAVMPILFSQFGSFSPIGLVTNVLILTFVPITMLSGFLVIFASIFSSYLAMLVGWIANAFVSYELFVIDIFSAIPAKISAASFPLWISAIYYVSLIAAIVYAKSRTVRQTSF